MSEAKTTTVQQRIAAALAREAADVSAKVDARLAEPVSEHAVTIVGSPELEPTPRPAWAHAASVPTAASVRDSCDRTIAMLDRLAASPGGDAETLQLLESQRSRLIVPHSLSREQVEQLVELAREGLAEAGRAT